MNQYKNIPQLIFGEVSAEKFNNIADFGAAFDKHSPRLRLISSLDSHSEFRSKFTSTTINQTKIMAFSHSSFYFEMTEERDCEIWIPLNGENQHNNHHGAFRLAEGENILFDQSHEKSVKSSKGSSVAIGIDLIRLNDIINAMNGSEPDTDHHLSKEGSVVLPLFMCGISFNQIFLNIFNQIDQLNGQPGALTISGIDEIIYRTLVLMMNKNLLEDHHANDRKDYGIRTEIRRLCEYLKTHLEDQINLTTMEKISGLSSRSLQYGFRKYFGCRPCEWLRNERLNLAKTKLTNSNDNMNITTLVYDLGFPSASLFSKYYKEKFGEKPSETLARKKQRIAANAM